MSEEISITKIICKLAHFLTLRTRYKVKTTVIPNFLVSSNNKNTYIILFTLFCGTMDQKQSVSTLKHTLKCFTDQEIN